MSLNTPDQLSLMIEVPLSVSTDTLQMALDDANLIVTEDLQPLKKGDGTPLLSVSRLTTLERYIAAHFITLLSERGGLTSSQTGSARDTYQDLAVRSPGPQGLPSGFEITRWGRQATMLDISKTLVRMSRSQLAAKFHVYNQSFRRHHPEFFP